jgi:replication factor C subunit 3/5
VNATLLSTSASSPNFPVVNRLIDSNKLPHLLFYGPAGTGKTSTILAAARRLYGEKYQGMTLELNASDARGINVVRDQIKEFAGTRKLFSTGSKLVILDEADAMTNDAQFALRRVIEKYSANTRFCLICNYVSKIIPALQSRCTRFRFSPLDEDQIGGRVRSIIEQEKANVSEDGFKAVLRLGCGDMRRVLNVLQATSTSYPIVDETNVYLCTGDPLPTDIKSIFHALLNDPFHESYAMIDSMIHDKGYALTDVLTEVAATLIKTRLPPKAYAYLVSELSNIEYAINFGTSDKLQMGALVGAFTIAREQMGQMMVDCS